MTLLWHGDQPIGICLFCTPALSLSQRSRFFGLKGSRTRLRCQMLNRQLVTLSRVVLHPTYRGIGLASVFIRRSCQLAPAAWIETLTEMGHWNPFFERAGFQRVGICAGKSPSRRRHSDIYGNLQRPLTKTSHRKSEYAQPVYYLFDNRHPQ